MAYEKTRQVVREDFNIDNMNDRRVIQDFDRELEPYWHRELIVLKGTKFEVILTGFSLYLQENGIFRYTSLYPLGAVADHEKYTFVMMKMRALDKLTSRRNFAAEEQMNSIVNT